MPDKKTSTTRFGLGVLLVLSLLPTSCSRTDPPTAIRLELPDSFDSRTLGRETRRILDGREPVRVTGAAEAACRIYTATGTTGTTGDNARFTLRARMADGEQSVLFDSEAAASEPANSVRAKEAAGWSEVVIPLPAKRIETLSFESSRSEEVWARPLLRCDDASNDYGDSAPNVILISLDTLRADRLGVLGNRHELTPNLDAFARRATSFSEAYATFPNTILSHGSIFTGLRPIDLGNLFDVRIHGLETLARAFSRAGYATAAFTENAFVGAAWGFANGFDLYHDRPGFGGGNTGHARETFSRGLKWLTERPPGPWFLFLHTYETHAPYNADPADIESLTARYHTDYKGPLKWSVLTRGMNLQSATGLDPHADTSRQIALLYDAVVRRLDRAFGELIDRLGEAGALNNTIVVVFSDHGESLMEAGVHGHGKTLNTEELRVPLIFFEPGRIPGNATVATPVSLIDLGPTIAQLAGIDHRLPEANTQSFVKRVLGDSTDEARPVFSEVLTGLAVCPDGVKDLCGTREISVRLDGQTYIDDGNGGGRLVNAVPALGGEQARRLRTRMAALTRGYRARSIERAHSAPPAPVDDETHRKLRGLGYVD